MQVTKTIVAETRKLVQDLLKNSSDSIPKPSQKFLYQMLLGMVARGSIMLSEIARFLDEPKALIQTEKRLSYQLNNRRWDCMNLIASHLKWAKKFIQRTTVIAFDFGDVTKEYAHNSPHLSRVWDGSQKKTSKGWWTIKAVCSLPHRQILPLFNQLFHGNGKKYRSHNMEVRKTMEFITAHIGTSGIWTFDRGFDDEKHFLFCNSLGVSFIIRLKGNRHLIPLHQPNIKQLSVVHIAKLLYKPAPNIAFVKIALPHSNLEATLVISYQRHNTLYFLTNLQIHSSTDACNIVKSYVKRWAVEDADRAMKQIFNIENIRSRTWCALERLVKICVLALSVLFRISLLPKTVVSKIISIVPYFTVPKKVLYYQLASAVCAALFISHPEKLIFR
jgi:hypothetical protein